MVGQDGVAMGVVAVVDMGTDTDTAVEAGVGTAEEGMVVVVVEGAAVEGEEETAVAVEEVVAEPPPLSVGRYVAAPVHEARSELI